MEAKGAKRKIFGISSIHTDDKKAANFQRNWSWTYIYHHLPDFLRKWLLTTDEIVILSQCLPYVQMVRLEYLCF